MCDSGTLGWPSLIMQGVGVLSQAGGAYTSSIATQASYEAQAMVDQNNAIMAEWQAQDALERGHLAEQRLGRDIAQTKASLRVRQAASGVALDVGTPLDIFAGVEAVAAEDVYTTRVNALNEAAGFRRQAINLRGEAAMYSNRAAAERPGQAFATSLLGGATQVAEKWYSYKKEGVI